MKLITISILITGLILIGCSDKNNDKKEEKNKKSDMYKTPPPSDRSKDKGF